MRNKKSALLSSAFFSVRLFSALLSPLKVSTEGTSDEGDKNPINLNSMPLNHATSFMQKTFNFQGTVDPTVNNNSTPQQGLNTLHSTGSATAGEEDEVPQKVS